MKIFPVAAVRWRVLVSVSVVAMITACAGMAPTAPRPKLVVFLAVDGLPQRQVTDYRDQLAPDGFSRFLDRGAWFPNAHYGHAFTVTAAGHATMLTGAYPHRTGVIGNEWRDPATGAAVYNTGDTRETYIGHKTDPLDGTSPRNLKVETLGDVLRQVDPRSKVIAISGKDRGAILPAGHKGTAYMYMDETGQFASSTYYMKEHPRWVDAFNAAKPADGYFKTLWKPLLPEAAYANDIPDDSAWFRWGGKLPMMMGAPDDDKPGLAFYSGLLASPFIDVLSLDFARAAIAGEQLGLDDAPDILVVSLSGHDYVNHRWSAESRLSHDHLLQLDRMLERFFRDLDRTVGKDNYVALLTADHGFTPPAEYSIAQGKDSGRANLGLILANVNAGLVQRFGGGKWVMDFSAATLLLDKKLIAQRNLDVDTVAEEARRLLLLEPGMGTAYTRRELMSGNASGPFFEASRNAWHPEVSGEVQLAFKPYWMPLSRTSLASHGSPHPYDTQVPILVYGPKWVKPGRIDAAAQVVDIAPTLARLLGVPAPSASEGRLLPLVAPQ